MRWLTAFFESLLGQGTTTNPPRGGQSYNVASYRNAKPDIGKAYANARRWR